MNNDINTNGNNDGVNSAKLREALLQVIRSMELESGHMCTEKKCLGMHGQTQEDLCKGCRARNDECWTMTLKRECEAALAAPPRECDRFTDEKQADALHAAFIEYCNECDCPMGCDHRKNPRFLLDGNCASIMKCFARFALSKATPKEGGAV